MTSYEAQRATMRQNERLIQRFNTECLCVAESRQLLKEILGSPVDASVTIQRPFYTDFGHNVTLGQRIWIASNVMLSGTAPITIADNVVIGADTYITTDKGPHQSDQPITIEEGAWIGAKSLVFPGVTVGRRAVVQVGSRVVADVPAGVTVAGSPARIIFNEQKETENYESNE